LDNRPFIADQWLKTENRKFSNADHDREFGSAQSSLPRFPSFEPFNQSLEAFPEENYKFRPDHFLTKGWTGDSLGSKQIKKTLSLLKKLNEFIITTIVHSQSFPPKLKNSIFQEFLSFCEARAVVVHDLPDPHKFWQMIQAPSDHYRQHILDFLNIYSYRCSSFYLLKLRFINQLSDSAQVQCTPLDLLNPSGLILKVFKKNSRYELKSNAFSPSVYSWFKPNKNMLSLVEQLYQTIGSISACDLFQTLNDLTCYESNHSIENKSIAHRNFGLFLNSIFVNNLMWLVHHQSEQNFSSQSDELDFLLTKYSGDNIEALAYSHWRAQENNMSFKWDQLICPEFYDHEEKETTFLNLFNELQFLTFLLQISENFPGEPLNFLCQTVNQCISQRSSDSGVQKDFFDTNDIGVQKNYHILLLSQLTPQKNNSHYSLLNKLEKQIHLVKELGHIVVLSNQNLFIHSVREKSKQLLKKIKLEAILNLEDIKGKGDVPNYVYIFSKIPYWGHEKNSHFTDPAFYNFRIKGQLSSFYQFSEVTNALNAFFKNHIMHLPPLVKYESQSGVKIDFYQDAIINGKLIQSASEDNSQITHPQFFKTLTSKCLPLDLLFEIRAIEQNLSFEKINKEQILIQKDFLRTNGPMILESSYIIIVNSKNKADVRVEIIPKSSFKARAYELGFTDCYYYECLPKYKNICINVIRDYFQSSIAKQLIQITCVGPYQKVRSKLANFLVPKFIHSEDNLPEHVDEGIGFLHLTEQELSNQSIVEIDHQFSIIKSFLMSSCKEYPFSIVKRLSLFKTSLQNCLINLRQLQHRFCTIDFNNNEIKTKLVQLKTFPLYPKNSDFKFDFKFNSGKPSDEMIQKVDLLTQSDSPTLILSNDQGCQVSIQGQLVSLLFVKHVAEHYTPISFKHFLENFQIPSANELIELSEKFGNTEAKYLNFIDKVKVLFDNILLNYFHSE
jgi:hypothetical protein